MNELQEIIKETIEEYWKDHVAKKGDYKLSRLKRQSPAKKDIKSLTELGLIDAMPKHWGYYDAKAVLSAANDGGSTEVYGGFTVAGDGYGGQIKKGSSKLYDYLNSPKDAMNYPHINMILGFC